MSCYKCGVEHTSVECPTEEREKMNFDYDIVYPCGCCGEKTTFYLCGKCAREKCPSCASPRADLRSIVCEIKSLWMKNPDWHKTDEGAHLLVQLFEAGEGDD
jgi:hypothetical protein